MSSESLKKNHKFCISNNTDIIIIVRKPTYLPHQ